MKALVTGATGFLGSHLCRRLAKEGWDLTVLCRPTSRLDALDGLKFKIVTGDVTDREAIEKATARNEIVFHAAAHGMYWGGEKDIQRATNVDGIQNVVDASLKFGIKKLVHVSSISAVGITDNRNRPATESFSFNLTHRSLAYHQSKRMAEDIALTSTTKGLPAVVVNPSSIWGPFGNKYRLEEFVGKVRNSKLVTYFTGGICPVHVDDVVDGIVAAAKSGRVGERYILGGENVTYKAIAEMTAKKLGLKRIFVPVPKTVSWSAAAILESSALLTRRRPRISFATHYCSNRFNYYDSTKARRELAFSPRPFEAILDECLAFTSSRNGVIRQQANIQKQTK